MKIIRVLVAIVLGFSLRISHAHDDSSDVSDASSLNTIYLSPPEIPEFLLPWDKSLNGKVKWTSGPHGYKQGGSLTAKIPSGEGSGLDFAMGGLEFEVLNMAAGEVIEVVNDCPTTTGLGCLVAIKHEVGETVMVYGHLKEGSVRVIKGRHYPPGEVLATAGSTGNSPQGIHLHIEFRRGDKKCYQNCMGKYLFSVVSVGQDLIDDLDQGDDVPEAISGQLTGLGYELPLHPTITVEQPGSWWAIRDTFFIMRLENETLNVYGGNYGNPFGWGDGLPIVDGYHIFAYRADSEGYKIYNYEGSAVKIDKRSSPRIIFDFPYYDVGSDGGNYPTKAIVTVHSSYYCDTNSKTCENNDPDKDGNLTEELTQFAKIPDGGVFGESMFTLEPMFLSSIATNTDDVPPGALDSSNSKSPDAIVTTDVLRVRTGPGTNYNRISWVHEFDELDVIGRVPDCSWLQVKTPSDIKGWVSRALGSNQYVTLNLPCKLIPIADIPPLPGDNISYVSIPASAVTVGSSPADIQQTLAECNETQGNCKVEWFNEPRSTVFVKDFEITKYEITNAQYEKCVEAGVCQGARRIISVDNDPPSKEVYFTNDYPVVGVSWYDANTFCQWIGGRLPTEVEWEKAARGTTDGRRYPWGNTFNPTDDPKKANLKSGGPSPVGHYSPQGDSPYGVADMAGNVFEWTATQAGDNYVIRGGSWYNYYFRGRVTDRGLQREPTFANYDVGFRCVRSAVPSPVPTPAPQIEFTADPMEIDVGECATLAWNVDNVREVYLNNEGVVGRGLKQVCPTSTTTYHLRVLRQDGGQEDKQQTITVHGSLPPQITFTADPMEINIGECTRLSWEVDNVREVYLGDDGVVGHSDKRVCPASTTTYHLRVLRQDGGQEDKQQTITVREGISYCQGDKSYDCTISATQEWQQTPLLLKSGDRFTISSIRGTWTVDRNHFPFVGPDGYSSEIDQQICCHDQCKTDGSQPYAKLLARIGNGSHFVAGSGGTFTADRAGFLALRINDEVACQENDAGSVTMRLERR